MRFRALDKNDDWTFGKGKSCYVKDNDAIRLNIKTRILSWVNDCFFDMNAGIDWYNRMGQRNQKDLLENDLRNIILKTDGVVEVVKFNITLTSSRVFTANYEVNTIYSTNFIDLVTKAI